MREILFRGKRVDNGKWVEGSFFAPDRILERWGNGFFNDIEIVPDTVGQYTGLTDKNGKKIFEGDIVCWIRGDDDDLWEGISKVEDIRDIPARLCGSNLKSLEVIGDIYDNPVC